MPDAERLAVLESEMRAHTKADELAYGRINADTSEIKQTLRDMQNDLKLAVERIHARIDENATSARAEAKIAMDFAQDAHDEIEKQRTRLYAGLVTILLGVTGWFADHFLGGRH